MAAIVYFVATSAHSFEPTPAAGGDWDLVRVVNLGTAGLPIGEFIGVQGDSRCAAAGVAVGKATMFDSAGVVGTAVITALTNPASQIDFTGTARSAR